MSHAASFPRPPTSSPCLEKLDLLGWAASVSVVAYGVRVGVRATDAGTLAAALERLPVGWSHDSAEVVDRLWSVIAGDDPQRTGTRRLSLLYANAARLARSRRIDDVLDVLENDVQLFVAERSRERLFVHAAVVGWHGQAIVLPGRSGTGKTTLAAELVRAGAEYYSDDYAPIDELGRVHPYPRQLSFRDGEGSSRRRVRPESLGAVGRMPIPVGLVVLTQYEEGADWSPGEVTPGNAVLGLLANTVAAQRDPESALAVNERVARAAVTIQGSRGDAAEAAARILEAADRVVLSETMR